MFGAGDKVMRRVGSAKTMAAPSKNPPPFSTSSTPAPNPTSQPHLNTRLESSRFCLPVFRHPHIGQDGLHHQANPEAPGLNQDRILVEICPPATN